MYIVHIAKLFVMHLVSDYQCEGLLKNMLWFSLGGQHCRLGIFIELTTRSK